MNNNVLNTYNLTIVNSADVKTVIPLRVVKNEKTYTEFSFNKRLNEGQYKYFIIEVIGDTLEQGLLDSGWMNVSIPSAKNTNIITKNEIKHGTF